MPVLLHGWTFSPYLRAARIALEEKGVRYSVNEMTPADLASDAGRSLTPFGRIPVLDHDGFRLFETSAILHYVDDRFPGPALQPADAAGRAEAAMLIGLAAHHFYPSGVMGVFFQEVYIPTNGGRADAAAVATGLAAAQPFLTFVEDRLGQAFLLGGSFTLADALVGPMIHNFALSPSGAQRLAAHPRLDAWRRRNADRPSFQSTQTPVPLFGLPA